MIRDGVSLDEHIGLKIRVANPQETDSFWRSHSKHFTGIFKHNYGSEFIVYLEGNHYQNRFMSIAGCKFKTIKDVEAKAKGILNDFKPGAVVRKPERDFVLELIKYHEKAESKLHDLKYFIVDFSERYPDTKSFRVVKKSGKEEDFSIMKCIKRAVKKGALWVSA